MKKTHKKTAKVIANIAKAMANKAGGAASGWYTYQTKEPRKPQK